MEEKQALLDRVKALRWTHTIDLGDGVVTPGLWKPSPLILKALGAIDFRDKKVLDIGCWDGLWSFEAERRGASEVYATDLVSHRPLREQATLDLARRVLDSKIKYFPNLSVYDVLDLGVRDFDVVMYCGVYYHLKDPLLALSQIRQVLKPGGTLLIEGEVIQNNDNSCAQFCYRTLHAHDKSTWWVPTIPCLREWIECSYFEIEREYNVAFDPLTPSKREALRKWAKSLFRRIKEPVRCSRMAVIAKAVCRHDANYYYPDEELASFDG